MKKALIGILLLFGTVSIAGAAPITFTDITEFTKDGTNSSEDLVSYGGLEVNKLEYSTDWMKWTHKYNFSQALDTVISGNLSLHLRDDDGIFDSCEFAFGWAEDGTWGFGEVDTEIYSYDVLAEFLADGEFTITLVSLYGDFYIDQSDLEITYEPVSEPVPEPATMLLFGAGLVGLAGIHRKKRA